MSYSNRLFLGSLFCIWVTAQGASMPTALFPFPFTNAWPIAGLWAAVAWSGSERSMRSVLALAGLGLFQDFINEAPLGAWVICFLFCNLAGLAVHRVFRANNDRMMAYSLALLVGLCVGLFALLVASTAAGGIPIDLRLAAVDFAITAALYFMVRPLFYVSRSLETER